MRAIFVEAERNPRRLNAGQLCALCAAIQRELRVIRAATSREVGHWRERALLIPDPALRKQAIESLERKRPNIDGAALFAIVPRASSRELVRLLVAYEVLGDFLDTTNESAGEMGVVNGMQLHQAMRDALASHVAERDYLDHHRWHRDGGYLRELVAVSRDAARELPSLRPALPHMERAARLATRCQTFNHAPDARERTARLRELACIEFPREAELSWFELAGGASAWLANLALFALAAEPGSTEREARSVADAYLPWIGLAGTMLDSYGDIAEDAANGTVGFLSAYDTIDEATERMVEVIRTATAKAAALPRGDRHLVLVASMVAMYLSKDSVYASEMRVRTNSILDRCGTLTRLLVPVLRCWRVANSLQKA